MPAAWPCCTIGGSGVHSQAGLIQGLFPGMLPCLLHPLGAYFSKTRPNAIFSPTSPLIIPQFLCPLLYAQIIPYHHLPWITAAAAAKTLQSDTTERLPFHFSLSCIGEGNGNPLQCSCLENPRDGGAWWAAIYGVTQSRI